MTDARNTPPSPKPQLTPHEISNVAVYAKMAPRRVTEYMQGRAQRRSTIWIVQDALAALDHAQVGDSTANNGSDARRARVHAAVDALLPNAGSTPPSQRPQLTPHEIRKVAAHAKLDPRRITEYMQGRRQRAITILLVQEALAALGHTDIGNGMIGEVNARRARVHAALDALLDAVQWEPEPPAQTAPAQEPNGQQLATLPAAGSAPQPCAPMDGGVRRLSRARKAA